MIIYEHNFFGCEKKIPCFFCFSQFPPLKRKSVFFTCQLPNLRRPYGLEVLLQAASWPSLPSEPSRRTRSDWPPQRWPMGKRLGVCLCEKVSKFSVGSWFFEFSVISMNFLVQKYPQFFVLIDHQTSCSQWSERLVSSELSRRSLTSWMRIARGERGMSNENHKNSVLLRILTGWRGMNHLLYFFFRFGMGFPVFEGQFYKDIFLMFAIWLFGKIIVDDFWVSPATSQAKG